MKFIENFILKIKQTVDKDIQEETSYDYHQWLLKLSKMVSSELKELNEDSAEKSIKPNDTLTMVLLFDKGHFTRNVLETMTHEELFKLANDSRTNAKIYTAKGYEEMMNAFKPKDVYVWTHIVNVPNDLVSNSKIIA